MTDSHGVEPEEARALLLLMGLPGVGPVSLYRLLESFGSAESALAAGWRSFRRAGGHRGRLLPGPDLRRHPDKVRLAERAFAKVVESGMTLCVRGKRGYPTALAQTEAAPAVLFMRGLGRIARRQGIAIVGSRRATEQGREMAYRLAGRVAATGRPVVSGLALGIDAAAHRGALAAGGPTVAVLGSGADVVYPRLNAHLYREIAQRGVVVSEFMPGEGAAPHHFPRRNRIISGLSRIVVVIEAGRRSGALITVDHALDQGRDVWAVPGPEGAYHWAGSAKILSEGATPLDSVEEFVQNCLGAAPEDSSRGPPEGVELYERLTFEPQSVDELAVGSGMDSSSLLSILSMLEIEGWAERCQGARFRRGRG